MNFIEAFRHTLVRQCEPNLLLSVAPSSKRFASVGNDGHVSLTEIQTSKSLGKFEFDPFPRLTCLAWVTSFNVLIGNEIGDVVQINLNKDPCPLDLPRISVIINPHKRPVKAISFDINRCLLALALDNEVQIWGLYTDHQWRLLDEVKCHDWLVSNIVFFGPHRHLLIVTSNGFIIWTDQGEPTSRLEGEVRDFSSTGTCDISPDNEWLATSVQNSGVLIWPLSYKGPVMNQQRALSIPTAQGQATAAGSVPVVFLDERTIVVADPTGTVYTMSLARETKQAFSVGPDSIIHSIRVCGDSVNVFATDAMQMTMLIGYTSGEATRHDDHEE